MIYFIDVDDTLVRTAGTTVIPMPRTVDFIKAHASPENTIYLWSRGGADYARQRARAVGVESPIEGFLPKPDVIIDDQSLLDWTHLSTFHPNEL
jgi:hypothetical protein